MWPRDNDRELDAFFGGRPDGSAKWEVTNLVYIDCPWTIYLGESDTELKRGIRVNKKVAADLSQILDEIWTYYGKSQAAIEKVDLHKFFGAYTPRARRDSKRISNHFRGIALDFDAVDNPMHKGSRGDMPKAVIDIFERHGWRWGGVYGDPMHFEAVWNGKAAPKPLTPPKPVEPPVAPVSAPSAPAIRHSLVAREAWVKAALPLIKRWEGYRATRYWDVKQWAIGFGSKADHLPPDTNISEAHASILLSVYLRELADKLAEIVQVSLTANQGAALLSFAYNLGLGALAKSTLLKKLNAADVWGAGNEFNRWTKAGGKVMPGLVKRRAAERELFDTP